MDVLTYAIVDLATKCLMASAACEFAFWTLRRFDKKLGSSVGQWIKDEAISSEKCIYYTARFIGILLLFIAIFSQ